MRRRRLNAAGRWNTAWHLHRTISGAFAESDEHRGSASRQVGGSIELLELRDSCVIDSHQCTIRRWDLRWLNLNLSSGRNFLGFGLRGLIWASVSVAQAASRVSVA